MNNSTQIIILSVLLSNLIIIIIAYQIFKGKLKKQEKALKKHFNSILGLGVSHLHDAANFFALIKQNINEETSKEAANFAKGAAFHFRSIFDELKTSFESFNQADIKDLSHAKFDLLYQKDTIDLKDLLEMELFQISNFSRVEIIDNSNTEHALGFGNYSLLSKAVLNLVENALKHTEGNVKLELKDNGKRWQIKISSFGKSVPEEIANNINTQNSIKTGHGLSSLIDILEFHNSKAEILTLADEGSSIVFELDKYSESKAEKYEKKHSSGPGFNFSPVIFIILSIILILLSSWVIIKHNRESCLDYFKSKTKILEKHELSNDYESKLEYMKSSLLELKRLTETYDADNTEDAIKEIEALKEDILENTLVTERTFQSYLIFRYLDLYSKPSLKEYIESEALKLIIYYPDSFILNHYKSEYLFKNKVYHKALFYSYKEFVSLFNEKLYLNPVTYSADQILEEYSKTNKLGLIMASMLKTPKQAPLQEQELTLIPEEAEKEPSKQAQSKPETPKFTGLDQNIRGNELLLDIENNEEINKYRAPMDFNERRDHAAKPNPPEEDLDALINLQDSNLELHYEL